LGRLGIGGCFVTGSPCRLAYLRRVGPGWLRYGPSSDVLEQLAALAGGDFWAVAALDVGEPNAGGFVVACDRSLRGFEEALPGRGAAGFDGCSSCSACSCIIFSAMRSRVDDRLGLEEVGVIG
jgi:hypothetical protein